MSEEDICSYVFSEQMMMRRLLSVLRESQSHCTETQCLDDPSVLPSVQVGGNGFWTIMICWFAIVLALYAMRPRSLRIHSDSKPSNNHGNDSDGPPPAQLD